MDTTKSADTQNIRIDGIRPMIPPAILLEQLPLSPEDASFVRRSRDEITHILSGSDDRLMVVVGPCSVHDTAAALEYAERLKKLKDELVEDLCIIMRVYFEKPRTTVGWKGLINDPRLDDSFEVNEGLHLARKLLLDLVAMGMPAGTEFLDPIIPQFVADALAWAAIGARTTESQVHRQLASGLSMPVGFKNGTGGGVQIAVDAVGAATNPHSFPGVTEQGLAGIVTTKGNPDCHVILRGGTNGPNYDTENVKNALEALGKAPLAPRLMIDASHANSGKDYKNQPKVAGDVAAQISAGENGIFGVMVESFLADGAQKLGDPKALTYGQSITDSCMGWEMTVPVLHELAGAVRLRRSTPSAS